ncbi:putative exported protein [Roseomonas mucosa]|uniref:DUF305 domain-containing protein n=2 Tax=Roseomonas mucosa TaxID=207340 RepID=A0A1S8D8K5_9PROT|nr:MULTISPECIES: DUF305 domain-containing protein [Roseomonas]MBS5901408.1 DUF305 domain-containing protein [Acetobacteraceae bacterium]MDT8262529.1 DUF305 domain-containing protein [Roseomonas sp. DSM 102946]ATR19780.1 DUF305 domain-containing protein [Roseomonas sp. FDAARGOS_362]AWV23809.1 putative exported protein [Roseomonas mucosa]MCG7351910.1 DUF305 domain-containing protein [Roseomonas mucosa]
MFRTLLLLGTLTLAQPAMAQMAGHGTHGASPAAPTAPPTGRAASSPSTAEYRAAMERMHKAMDIPYTGDADKDFVAGMIPHHQGAIDMARTVLKYGKDPEIRKIAQDVIAAQEREIKELEAIRKRLN